MGWIHSDVSSNFCEVKLFFLLNAMFAAVTDTESELLARRLHRSRRVMATFEQRPTSVSNSFLKGPRRLRAISPNVV